LLGAFFLAAVMTIPQLASAAPVRSPTAPSSPGVTTGGGAESRPAPVYGYSSRKVIRRVNTDEKIVALTLDDGYHLDPRILDLVETWGIRGTAFLVGQVAHDHPEFVRRLVDIGWEVCSHTYNHPKLTSIGDYQMYREISRASKTVNDISGQLCSYFRPPYGAVDGRVVSTADNLGLRIINWDSSISDSTKPGADPRVQEAIAYKYVRPGSILLGHWGAVNSYEVLKNVLTSLLGAGYHVGTVTDLLRAGGYSVASPAATDAAPVQPAVASAAPDATATPAVVESAPEPIPLQTSKASSTKTTIAAIAGTLAVIFVLLIVLRARVRRRRRVAQAAKKKLARDREPEHSHQR
jgi:peptidoglycan/xylan/chitin deacetylase (PgdA/CDA1 family)